MSAENWKWNKSKEKHQMVESSQLSHFFSVWMNWIDCFTRYLMENSLPETTYHIVMDKDDLLKHAIIFFFFFIIFYQQKFSFAMKMFTLFFALYLVLKAYTRIEYFTLSRIFSSIGYVTIKQANVCFFHLIPVKCEEQQFVWNFRFSSFFFAFLSSCSSFKLERKMLGQKEARNKKKINENSMNVFEPSTISIEIPSFIGLSALVRFLLTQFLFDFCFSFVVR